MAWQKCGKCMLQRLQRVSAEKASPLISSTLVSSISQPGVTSSRYQGHRFLHHRLKCAWDVAKSNVARVPSLLPSRPRGAMSFCRKFTSLVVLGATGIGGFSIYDDYLIFQQCSKRALDKANSYPDLKTILGENIEQGPWYEATMGVDHEGHSASCSFPVSGSLGSGHLHLRAVRYEEKYKWLTPYLPGMAGGRWEVLVLEASLPTRRLSLLHPDTRPKAGDRGGGGPCGTPSTIGHHEV